MSIKVEGQDISLRRWVDMLNEGRASSFILKNVLVTKAYKKIGEIGADSIKGVFIIESRGYKTEVHFDAKEFDTIREIAAD